MGWHVVPIIPKFKSGSCDRNNGISGTTSPATTQYQAIQFMIADMSSHIEAARLLLRKAAFLCDQGRSYSREASEAKLFSSDLAVKVATDGLQIQGAYGYSKEYPIERIYRDAKVYQIWEGTSQIQRMVIARHLLK